MNAIELFNNPFIYSQMNIEQKIEFLQQNLNKPIVFVGFMGAGKTSIGQAIANVMEGVFVDSDHVVAQEEGCTLPELFEDKGEAYFAEKEKEAIIRLISDEGVKVIGTGGRAFLHDIGRQVILDKAVSIFLKADFDVLRARLGDCAERPTFKGKNINETLDQLIGQRYPIYKQADIAVETKDEPLQETLNRVIESLYSHLTEG